MIYFLVGMGGVVGAGLRFLFSLLFNHQILHGFPLATFITNIIGCFLIGWFTTFLVRLKFLHPHIITALTTGLIGSFTTFSTFSVETIHLITSSNWEIAIFYIFISLLGGLLFSWFGYCLGHFNWKKKIGGEV